MQLRLKAKKLVTPLYVFIESNFLFKRVQVKKIIYL